MVYNRIFLNTQTLRGSESTPRQVYSLQECYNSFYCSSVCPTLLPVVALPPRRCGNGQSLLILRLRGPWRFLCVIKWSLNQLVRKSFLLFLVLQHRCGKYFICEKQQTKWTCFGSLYLANVITTASPMLESTVYVVTTTGKKLQENYFVRVKLPGIFWARFLRMKAIPRALLLLVSF